MHARFIKSATRKEDYPASTLPKIAFVGRSNVGKSSLINSLVGTKGLARTSGTPGRTQTINFFQIEQELFFVDLPGYGFARVPEHIQAAWGPMIEEFLREDRTLKLTVLIIDSRHGATRLDRMLQRWLSSFEIPHLVVATKADKLSRSQLQISLRQAERDLELAEVLPYSAATGMGKKRLWQAIRTAVASDC